MVINPYIPGPSPRLEGSDRRYLDNELQKIAKSMESVRAAIAEIQKYMDEHP